MKRAKKWFSLVLLVVMVTALLAGCAKAPAPTQAPAKTSAPAPTATQAPAKTTAPAPGKTPSPTAAAPKAESLDDFFAKNRVTLIVPYAAGGASDYAGRIYASFWTEVTGGSMIVKNNPGGGSTLGMEQVYAAKPDGLTLGYVNSGGLVSRSLFDDPKPKFEATKFTWLGYMSQDAVFLISSAKKPYNSLQDLQKAKDLKAPSLGVIDGWSIYAATFCELLGLDGKIIPGFDSATEACLALARGELDFTMSFSSYLRLIFKKGDYKGPYTVLQRERSKLYPDVPAITEQTTMTPEKDAVLRLAEANFSGRSPIAPPNMDKARVDFMRAKTKQIFALKPYLQQAKLQWQDWEEPLDGEKMQKAVETAVGTDPSKAVTLVNKVVRSRIVVK